MTDDGLQGSGYDPAVLAAAGATAPLNETGARTLAESVADQIRGAILAGELAPGTPVRLNETARRLGVSVMPIRDALRLLEAEQLVTFVPRRGARVSDLSAEDVEELYAIRAALEALATKVAVRRMTDSTAEHLQHLFDEMAAAHKAGSVEEFVRCDRLFHRTLYTAANRPRLVKRILDLWANSARVVPLVYRSWLPAIAALESHRIILSAVLARNPEAAERFTREHTEQAAARILKALEEQSSLRRGKRRRRSPPSSGEPASKES